MKFGMMFLAIGTVALFLGLLLRQVSLANALEHVPPYMGPPSDTSILHAIRMWAFPYVLDTFSIITLGVSLGLIALGLVVLLRRKAKPVPEKESWENYTIYPYQ